MAFIETNKTIFFGGWGSDLKLDRIYRLYYKHQDLIFLALTPKVLYKKYMNNSYTFSFLAGTICLCNMVLTYRDEVIQ